jgi:hypothetical protein
MILYNLRYQLPMLRSFAVLGGSVRFPSPAPEFPNVFIPQPFSDSYVTALVILLQRVIQPMAQRDNLYRRPSGIYVLRITVPVRYRALIGQREIHASTRTTHLANARAIAARLLEKWYASLEEFRQVDKEKIRGNAPLLAGAGKISLACFANHLMLGLRLLFQHLLADNIPLYACVEASGAF